MHFLVDMTRQDGKKQMNIGDQKELLEMKNIGILFAGMLAMSVSSFASERAALLSDIGGKVLVNKGEGFVAARSDMVLSSGDRVLVGDESFAVLSYNGCAVSLDRPAVIVVKGEEVCETGVQGVGVLVRPTADVAPAPFFIPPVAILSTVAIVGVTCAVGCKKIFGGNRGGVSP
jgi:hypothetical protein